MVTRPRVRLLWMVFVQALALVGNVLATPIVSEPWNAADEVFFEPGENDEPVFFDSSHSADFGTELPELGLNSDLHRRASPNPYPSLGSGGPSLDRWFASPADAGAMSARSAKLEMERRSLPAPATAGRERVLPSGEVASQALAAEMGEPIAQTVREVERWVVEAVAEALDVRRGERAGQVSFSLAGVEELQLTRSEGGLALGYEGNTLLATERANDMARQRSLAAASAASPVASQASSGIGLIGQLINMVKDAVEYPLFWIVCALLLAGKIAWLVARRISASERREQRRSASHGRHEHRYSQARSVRLPADRGGRPVAH